ncbi:hypothetical protein E4T48_02426 [Aureobasidium sp. EXF-10727]|nr:hypothetical protein E4T48_02426 [Aureobasidium sp. EXF-10727]
MAPKDPPEKHFASMLDQLHENGAYSDLKIVCGADTYNVHKAIICPQSDFFRAACRPDTFEEGKTGVINLPTSSGRDSSAVLAIAPDDFDWDLDVETTTSVKLMVHYFYHHDYLERDIEGTDWRRPILTEHARMYAMGEKYGVRGLKTLALAKFTSAECFIRGDVLTAAVIAYHGTPEADKDLREASVTRFHSFSNWMKRDETVLRFMSKTPEFAYALYLESIGPCEPWG